MEKRVRVAKKYGEWFYTKEYDIEDKNNYMYYFNGVDNNGKYWNWSTPFYNEMLDFIRADEITKTIYMKNY